MRTETTNIPNENQVAAISQQLQYSQGMTTRELLIFAGIGAAIAFVVLAFTLAFRAMGWWNQNSPAGLFRELCKAHKLGGAERSLIRKLVRGLKMEDPSLIFVLPERFDQNTLPAKLKHRSEEIAKLREQIFGSAA